MTLEIVTAEEIKNILAIKNLIVRYMPYTFLFGATVFIVLNHSAPISRLKGAIFSPQEFVYSQIFFSCVDTSAENFLHVITVAKQKEVKFAEAYNK